MVVVVVVVMGWRMENLGDWNGGSQERLPTHLLTGPVAVMNACIANQSLLGIINVLA